MRMSRSFPNDSWDNRRKEIYTKDERVKYRVSLNITLFQNDKDPVQLSAITAGGSQAVFFKINTWGEEAFLDKLIELLDFAN